MKNEKDVKAKVKKLLDKHSWFWWMPPANGYGKVGISVFLAIETKFGSNKPTAHQRAFLESVNAEHAFAFVVSDSNIEWFEAFLEDFGKETDLVAAEKKMSNDGGARLVDAIRALQALI
jgi:hypothetical protein